MDYLNVFTTFLGLEYQLQAVNGGTESSQIGLKRSPFVFWIWTKVLQVWKCMRVS